ncbi:hypothetical protein PC115_g7293 [Phytophthora cactorum]|uniref:Uncharacterized protein n=1 Tax=Phytophthora cactorum TaxID=29920 RepID=A0A8T1CUN0_9STRA|nr:hypothetical protein PC115_g7293 [Phytophthora cactorum]
MSRQATIFSEINYGTLTNLYHLWLGGGLGREGAAGVGTVLKTRIVDEKRGVQLRSSTPTCRQARRRTKGNV